MNWQVGWWLILAAFASGAIVGLWFHNENFLGGYGSFPRRMLRLAHVACAALGMLNVVLGAVPWGGEFAGMCFVVGGITMPTVCYLTILRKKLRHLFCIPVVSLVLGVVSILLRGGR